MWTRGAATRPIHADKVKSYHSFSETTKAQCVPELEQYRDVLRILVDENVRWHFSFDL